MAEERSALEAALDALVYIPVGFLLTAGEEVPKLAAKGRQRMGTRLTGARMLGELAVTQGRREVTRLATQLAQGAARPAPGATAAPGPTEPAPEASTGPSGRATAPATSPSRPVATRAAAATASPSDLAIPAYDSLSASQVVSRLAGLSDSELAGVRAYEAATRGRRTILTRIAQLQAS
jgi:hypothetical protein